MWVFMSSMIDVKRIGFCIPLGASSSHLIHYFGVTGIGSSLGTLVLFLFAWRLHKAINKRWTMRLKQKYLKLNGGLLLQDLFSLEGNIGKSKLFDSKEFEKVTDCFNDDRVLGRGGQ